MIVGEAEDADRTRQLAKEYVISTFTIQLHILPLPSRVLGIFSAHSSSGRDARTLGGPCRQGALLPDDGLDARQCVAERYMKSWSEEL